MIGKDEIKGRKFVERELLRELRPWIDRREAVVLLGARRVGKTSLLMLIAQKITEFRDDVFYFDMEDPDDRDIMDDGPKALKRFIGGHGVVMIDEFHLMNNPSNFVKLTVDHHPEIKLFLSGSSSTAILSNFRDSMIGRIVEFELYPLSFREFLRFKGESSYMNMLPELDVKAPDLPKFRLPERIMELYLEYLLYGGFPEVVLADEVDVKTKLLSQIFRIYAVRDMKLLLSGRDAATFEKVFLALIGTAGNLLNLTELARDVGVSVKTVQSYVRLLEALFLVKRLHPFGKNPRTEIKKAPKVYIVDTGLISWGLGNFSSLRHRPKEAGIYAENGVFLGLIRRLKPHQRLRFWRKKSGVEVDFLLLDGGLNIPIEVKFKDRATIPSSLRSFCRKYQPPHAIVATKSLSAQDKIDGTDVLMLPAPLLS